VKKQFVEEVREEIRQAYEEVLAGDNRQLRNENLQLRGENERFRRRLAALEAFMMNGSRLPPSGRVEEDDVDDDTGPNHGGGDGESLE
jgi:regulator of replication initiation timing